MSDHGNTEEKGTGISSENVEGEVFDVQTMPQKDVIEKIRGFIAPLTLELEELTRLVQGTTNTRHPIYYPRTEFGTTSGTAIPQFDKHAFGVLK